MLIHGEGKAGQQRLKRNNFHFDHHDDGDDDVDDDDDDDDDDDGKDEEIINISTLTLSFSGWRHFRPKQKGGF